MEKSLLCMWSEGQGSEFQTNRLHNYINISDIEVAVPAVSGNNWHVEE